MIRKTRLLTASAVLLCAVGFLIPASLLPVLRAQASITSTTLSAALASPAQGSPATTVTLASGTGVAVGQGMVIDGEYLTVTAATSATTRWTVQRGQGGTVAGPHASGAPVFIGPGNYFSFGSRDLGGPCTSTLETALPRFVIGPQGVSVYDCAAVSTLAGSAASTWSKISENGRPTPAPTRYTGWVYDTAGAITIQGGVQFIGSSGALAMTLAAPSKYQDGMVMVLQASTAQAHTVTYTAGFYGTTTSSDVATFGGAIGDNFVVYASGGVWRIQSLKGVTIG